MIIRQRIAQMNKNDPTNFKINQILADLLTEEIPTHKADCGHTCVGNGEDAIALGHRPIVIIILIRRRRRRENGRSQQLPGQVQPMFL
jgi:hypothetical protein